MSKSMVQIETKDGMVLTKSMVFVIPRVGEKINLKIGSPQKYRSFWYKVTSVIHDWHVLQIRDGTGEVDVIDEGWVRIIVEE
jgi:hypothetical protein